jgi:APA family basic amino acid/polyamine antiporter
VLAMLGDFNQLLTYVVFAGWIFYGIGAAALFVYRRRIPESERPYSVPGYPMTPALFILSAAVLVVNTVWVNVRQQALYTAVAVGIILLGLPAYLIWRRGAEKK